VYIEIFIFDCDVFQVRESANIKENEIIMGDLLFFVQGCN